MPGIAVVEDEYIVALDIKSFLERSGYSFAGMFPSGEELLASFGELRPDLVLMDIKIRGQLDGVETARLVHERYRTPVVLLTAYADDETVARAKMTQPFGYIIKPFEERELKTAIEIALYRGAMEKRLVESEERYRNLFYEGISANFLADLDGRVSEANPAFRALIGLGPERDLPELPSLMASSGAWVALADAAKKGKRTELAELALKGVDGRELYVLANAAPVAGRSGEIEGIRGELIDTTERRKLEERLRLAQKMDAAGKLAGGIAHDFNNILTAILGYSNLLADELPAGAKMRDDVDGIRKAADRASNLTRQLLAFSRRQPASPKRMDLGESVREVERLLRRLLPEDIALSLLLDKDEAPIFADPSQIEQIILNLAFNARDAMPSGGSLRLSTSVESVDGPSAPGLEPLSPGRYVALRVRDTGTGIAPEMLDKIFEPFFTTKARDRGTGLGLSTVYGIARQLGGSVGVESTLGKGSTFTVWIPLSPEARVEFDEESRESPWLDCPTATVLFVDDDESVRTLASRLLAKGGHNVLAAANAGEAVMIAEGHEGPIDLLVTDIVMPFMDGRSLAKRIAELRPKTRVLFVSGHPGRGAELFEGGGFLAKPFNEAELAKAVKRALAT